MWRGRDYLALLDGPSCPVLQNKNLRDSFYYQHGAYITKTSESLKTLNTSLKKGMIKSINKSL